MKGSSAVASILLAAAVLSTGWYLLQKSGNGKVRPAPESEIAAAMKQEIFDLKQSFKMNTNFVFSPAFEVAVQAELRGDKQFANGDYESASRSYAQALGNLRKVRGEFNTDSTHQTGKNVTATPDKREAEQDQPVVVGTTMRRREPENSPGEARRRSGVDEMETNIRKSTPASEMALSAVASPPKAETTAATAALAATKNEEVRPKREETQSAREAQLLKASAASHEVAKVDSPAAESAAADQPVESMARTGGGAPRDFQSEIQWQETARRDIAVLANAYQNSLAAKDLGGFKMLFRENFVIKQEKEWSGFFDQATDVRASVEAKNYKIDASASEVDLVVTLRYSNRKGIAQKPLKFAEAWTLRRQNGKWTVVARRFE